jgi:hypothetical protein
MRAFYVMVNRPRNTVTKPTSLAKAAMVAAETYHIRDQAARFVADHNLAQARIPDVGSGVVSFRKL